MVALVAMPAVFEHFLTVRDDEIDQLGHVGNLVYLRWTQAAALAHSAAQGWSADAYHKLGSGFVVRSHNIEYHRPALLHDEVVVRTWVAGFRRASSLRRFKIARRNNGQVLATAATDWAFIRFETGMPTRIPPEIRAAFELVEDADDP